MAESRQRPVIAIPARFSQSASALRFEAEVTARRLVTAVYAAGGDPVTMHPHAPGGLADEAEIADRLRFADGVLLPGGGDLSTRWQPAHPSLYHTDEEQDAFDLALGRVALEGGLPLLAICRGLQVVNVMQGGTLHSDMGELAGLAADHRHRVHQVRAEADSELARRGYSRLTVSCFHHQCIDRLGKGLRAVAHSEDGVVEAVELDDSAGWFLGVQWHPEDTATEDPSQAAIFAAHVEACRAR
jgi:putative glutamine amidotransferase